MEPTTPSGNMPKYVLSAESMLQSRGPGDPLTPGLSDYFADIGSHTSRWLVTGGRNRFPIPFCHRTCDLIGGEPVETTGESGGDQSKAKRITCPTNHRTQMQHHNKKEGHPGVFARD